MRRQTATEAHFKRTAVYLAPAAYGEAVDMEKMLAFCRKYIEAHRELRLMRIYRDEKVEIIKAWAGQEKMKTENQDVVGCSEDGGISADGYQKGVQTESQGAAGCSGDGGTSADYCKGGVQRDSLSVAVCSGDSEISADCCKGGVQRDNLSVAVCSGDSGISADCCKEVKKKRSPLAVSGNDAWKQLLIDTETSAVEVVVIGAARTVAPSISNLESIVKNYFIPCGIRFVDVEA